MTDQETKLMRYVLGMHETTRVPVRNGISAKGAETYGYTDALPGLIERGFLLHHPGAGRREYKATRLGVQRTMQQPWM